MLRRNLGSRNSDPEVLDQLMRDLSNFDAIGELGDSRKLKMRNRRMSQDAFDLIGRCSSFGHWHKLTTNDHSTPINVLQKQIVEGLLSITDDEIARMFRDNPVCTVTNEENNKLVELGFQSRGTYKERYAAEGGAGIVIVTSPLKPYLQWR